MNQTNEPVVKPLWLVIDEQGYPIHCGSYKEGCNEHINDAINDYQLEEAVHWKVIEATPIEPNTITITAAEYAKLKEDAERMNWLSNGGWEVLLDPKYWYLGKDVRQTIDDAFKESK